MKTKNSFSFPHLFKVQFFKNILEYKQYNDLVDNVTTKKKLQRRTHLKRTDKEWKKRVLQKKGKRA